MLKIPAATQLPAPIAARHIAPPNSCGRNECKKESHMKGNSQSGVFYEPQLEETPQSDDNKCLPSYNR